jgi:hypothetical protein
MRKANGQFEKGHNIGREYRFKKGNKAWNKGIKGKCEANSGSFTHERIDEIGRKSIGVPKHYSKGIVCLVDERKEVIDSRNGRVYKMRIKIPYARYVLQQNGIEVPKGYVVYHKDGDSENNDVSNLEVISRAELIKRNRA